MPFAWSDIRNGGRIKKLPQGGEEFVPWPNFHVPAEEEEEISAGATVISARWLCGAWQHLLDHDTSLRKQREFERSAPQWNMQEDPSGALVLHCFRAHLPELPARKRESANGQDLQSLTGQVSYGGSDGAEQGLQKEILRLSRDLVLHKLLPCLPLPKIFELRCVSQEWKSFLCSPYFVRQCIATQQRQQAWLVMAGRARGPNKQAKEFIAYVPSLGRWIPFPFPSSPPISTCLGRHAELVQERDKYHGHRNPTKILMASAGGLICCSVYNVPLDSIPWLETALNFKVLVFNPLTGHMKTLPPHSVTGMGHSSSRLYMFYDKADGSYKILLCSHQKSIHVYNSKSGSWKVIHAHQSSNIGILNADLFFYDSDGGDAWLYGYHMESDMWSSLNVPMPPRFRSRCGGIFLEKVNGRVMLAYDFRPSAAPSELQGFTLWELNYPSSSNSTMGAWVQVARTPPKFWNRFHDVFVFHDIPSETSFLTSGRLLCMTAVDFVDEDYGGYYSTPLVFDLHLKLWYKLPPYKGTRRFMGLFSFEPTLNLPM